MERERERESAEKRPEKQFERMQKRKKKLQKKGLEFEILLEIENHFSAQQRRSQPNELLKNGPKWSIWELHSAGMLTSVREVSIKRFE